MQFFSNFEDFISDNKKMGNSNAATISISINSNNGLVIPGKEISGKVYVQMLKENVGDHALIVKIVGVETTLIDYSSDHCNQDSGTEIYEAGSVFF
jgi:hypothetical protein